MNKTLGMPSALGVVHVADMLAAPRLSREADARQLSRAAGGALRSILVIIDNLIMACIEKKTAEQFQQTRADVFPQYFVAVRALSDVAKIVVPRRSLEVLTVQSFSEVEAEFRDNGLDAFGADVRDQAMFTVWTLRKISDLCQRIALCELPEDLNEVDADLHKEFVYSALHSRFHLDCLLKSMQARKPIFPEVLDVVVDGLRGAVNAYTWARRAFDLRNPPSQATSEPAAWDDEDRQLLNEANLELIPEP